MDNLFYAVSVLVFTAVVLAIEAGWQWWFSNQSEAARRLSRRLREMHTSDGAKPNNAGGLLKDNRLSRSTTVDTFLRRLPGILHLQIFL
ncbi:MAG: hypothetical protein RL618_1685, partial [Pseudomonadota bacterium]